jgi:hypothetical protein
LYADAVQYTPVFNGLAGWQLYNGDGFTNSVLFPLDKWVPVRIEVAGRQARVFVGGDEKPCLEVHDLKHGLSEGGVALFGEGSAYFSNVRSARCVARSPPRRPTRSRRGLGFLGVPAFSSIRVTIPDNDSSPMRNRVPAEPGAVDIARPSGITTEPETVLARPSSARKEAGRRLAGFR